MTIRLRIDNCDALPDGGPLDYSSNRCGFDFGRETHLDWTLPDDSRYISGRHCEIRYDQGKYWLHDISRNGTFINGAQERVKSPYELQDGDRISIGHYIVEVKIENPAGTDYAEPDHGAVEASHAQPTEDIWATGGEVPAPIDRRDMMPAQKQGQRAPDFSQQYLELPEIRTDQGFQAAVSSPQSPPQTPIAGPPQPPPVFPPDGSNPFGASRDQMPVVPSPYQQEPPAAQPAASNQTVATMELLQHIAEGAGVPVECFASSDPAALGQEIGGALRIVIEQMAQLLKARAAAKTMAKSANRTMISAADNNPLKFVPTTEEMFDVMFGRRKAGYMGARESLEQGFSDLKTHEYATYAAMQKALARLLDDLSPESIEAKLNSSAFASKNSKAWETYVTRWEAMTEPHDNGMLDVFLNYFSDSYDDISKKTNK